MSVAIVDLPLTGQLEVEAPSDPPAQPTGMAPPIHDATADFVAQITVSSTELSSAPFDVDLSPPYAAAPIAPTLSSFPLDTQAIPLVNGQLALELSLAAPPIAPFATGALPTRMSTNEPLTLGLATIARNAVAVGPFAYFVASEDIIRQNLYRYSPIGPVLERITDVEAEGGIFSTLGAAFGDWLVFETELGPGLEKPILFDTSTSTLTQISDLNSVGSDAAEQFVRLDDCLYFVAGPIFSERRVYRFAQGTGSAQATLERVSFTSDDGADNPLDLVVVGNALYFTALHADTNERHLFRFLPDSLEQQRLTTSSQANVDGLRVVGDELFVLAQGSGGAQKLHRVDTDAERLVQIADFSEDPATSDLLEFQDGSQTRLLVEARNAAGGRKLFVYDPETEVLRQASNSAGPAISDNILEVVDLGDELLVAACNGMGSSKLYRFDLNTGEHTQVVDANGPEINDSPCGFIVREDGTLAFAMDLESTGGFSLVELAPGQDLPSITADPGGPSEQDDVIPLIELDSQLIFLAGPFTERQLFGTD